MIIVNTLKDVQDYKISEKISPELAAHFEKKLTQLKRTLSPETTLEDFGLHTHGGFALLEKADRNLTAAGLSERLDQVMPEWVSRLVLADETYYILYCMADNDYVIQVYLPDSIMEEKVRLWLNEQPIEDEDNDFDVPDDQKHPF